MKGKKNRVTGSAMKGHKQSVSFEAPVYRNLMNNVGKDKIFKDVPHAVNLSVRDKMIAAGVWVEQ